MLPGGSEEFSRNIEADVPGVTSHATARQLRHGGAEAVGEVDLEAVAARALFDAEAGMRRIRLVSKPGDHFTNEIHRRAHTQPGAEADDERVVLLHDLRGKLVRVVDPD